MLKRAMSAACVCVPMSAMAEPAQLSGREIGEMLPGATIQIDAPLGYKLPVRYGSDGTLSGEAGDLISYLGSATDTGKWWIKGDHVCHKWSKWLDAKLQCMHLRKEGRILHWVNQDGDKGTATITVMAAAKPQTPAMPMAVAHAAPAPAAPRLIARVPTERDADDVPVPAPAPAAAKPAPQTTASVVAPQRTVPPAPAPATRTAAQLVQTAAGVRNMASQPVTAPASGPEPRTQSSFVVANVRENDVLNVRSGPSSEYEVVASLRPGSRGVAITGECQSDWCPVRHQDAIGWVNSVYLANEAVGVTQAAFRTAPRQSPQGMIPVTAFRESADAPRSCLTHAARALLQMIEAKFGSVKVVSTCRAGATIAGTGRPSRHASGNAVDFNAGARKGEILRWLIANHKTGGTMTYPDMDHVHVDVGPHFVSIAGGQNTASWRGSRGSGRAGAQDDDD